MSKKSSSRRQDQKDLTHFGYRKVSPDEKAPLVREVFDSVASNYDTMNDLMSFGIHRIWKNTLMDWLRPLPSMTLLDVGGGTGDIAFRFLERGGAYVSVIDINHEMLAQGRNRALNRGILDNIEWIHGDAEALPIKDMSVDAYTAAFSLRNVTNINRALLEARRVLKPGGRFLCLEFSQITLPAVSLLYDKYSFSALPALGEIIANDRNAYRYLAESIRQFPNQTEFASLIAEADFGQIRYRNLTGGIAAIHSAWRI